MPDSSSFGKPGLLRRLWGGSPEKTKTVRLPVHAYGKLPIYKDFISSGMTDAPAQEFRAWLDKGFSHRWSADEGCRETEIPPHSFLLRMPVSKGYAAGSLWGSSDEGGLRKFPFALFFSFPKDHGAADPVAAVEYLGEVERRASELRFLFGPGSSLSSFYQTYRGAELELALHSREQIARDFRSELSDFSVGEFAESLFGDEAAPGWAALLAAAGAGAEGPGAVRLPLGGRLPRAREVEFWLFWLSRQDPKGRRPVTGVLYPHGHNPGRAVFFFRDIRPEDFLLLHPTRADLPQVHEPLGRAAAWVPPARAAGRATPSASASASVVPSRAEEAPAVAGTVVPAPVPEAEAAPAPSPSPGASQASALPPLESEAPPGPLDAPASAPAAAVELREEESPFPEADVVPEPTAGVRLSQILTLDLAGGERSPETEATLAQAPKTELAAPLVEPAPEPELLPALEAPSAAPAPAVPAEQPVSPTMPEPPPTPVAEPVVSAAIPAPPPAPPSIPARPPVPPPPGWERPLAVLLDP